MDNKETSKDVIWNEFLGFLWKFFAREYVCGVEFGESQLSLDWSQWQIPTFSPRVLAPAEGFRKKEKKVSLSFLNSDFERIEKWPLKPRPKRWRPALEKIVMELTYLDCQATRLKKYMVFK